ncbi:MAG: phosphate ABC transporter permease subunit PstC, partial [Bacteroidales bacterium]|nr:phosphate ABC transporter permease subunit PstC [Bacteroidales bacterium]
MRKLFERIIEGILACSGYITSVVIILIVVFLFREAFGLFKSPAVEEGYTIALNKANKVSEDQFHAQTLKLVFDSEITNWSNLGGSDQEIQLFRLDDLTNYYTEEEL